MRLLLLILASSLILSGCWGKTSKKSEASTNSIDSTASVDQPKVNYNRHYASPYNQAARIIAGINDPTDTLFKKVRTSTVWKNYTLESDTVWQSYHRKNQSLYSWVKSEVLPHTENMTNVFYPLSGPDFLYGNLIFPNSETVYMFGLEEIGSIPNFETITQSEIDQYITFYKRSISEVLRDSFYHTNGMKVYLNNENIDGVIPVFMLFLAKSEKQISEINHLTLNDDGTIKIVENDAKFKRLTNRGVEIKYYNGTDDIERRIYFFTGNIADGGLGENPAYKNYYASLRPEGAFLKSATYLLHKSYFSTIRNVILDNCRTVVSDDSGIAYKFYKPELWNVQLYGKYSKPIGLFDNLYEPDLYQAYQKTENIKPLNFRIGYSNPSNMRVATRKK